MGVMPLQFQNGETRKTLGLVGDEKISITPIGELKPRMEFDLEVKRANGEVVKTKLISRVDTLDELNYFKNGGILQYVLRNLKNS
jgi:aconitate hydratase